MPKSFLDLVNDAMKGQGISIIFPDSQLAALSRGAWPKDGVQNASVATQTLTAATKAYIAGSALAVPPSGLQVGSTFKWKLNLTKTGAGSATSLVEIVFGTLGTTADTTQISITKPAGTAAADAGQIEITMVVRSVGATGVVVANFLMTHNLAATGHLVIPSAVINTISSGFVTTTANLIVGLCITTGAADAVTVEMCQAEAHGF